MSFCKRLLTSMFVITSLSNIPIGYSINFEQYAELNDTALKEFFDPYRENDEVADYPNTIDVSFNNSVHTIGILSDGNSNKLHILKPKKKSSHKTQNQQVMVRIDLREFGISLNNNLMLKAAAANTTTIMVALFDDVNNKNYLFKITNKYQVKLMSLPDDFVPITEINNVGDFWLLNSGALVSSNSGNTWEDFEVNGNISGQPHNIVKIKDTYFGLGRRLINPVAPLELYWSQDLIDWELVQLPIGDEPLDPQKSNIVKIYTVKDTLIAQLWKQQLENGEYSYIYSNDNGQSWQNVERDLRAFDISNIFAVNGKLHLVMMPKTGEKLLQYVVADENYLFNPVTEKDFETELASLSTVFDTGNNIALVVNELESSKKYYFFLT